MGHQRPETLIRASMPSERRGDIRGKHTQRGAESSETHQHEPMAPQADRARHAPDCGPRPRHRDPREPRETGLMTPEIRTCRKPETEVAELSLRGPNFPPSFVRTRLVRENPETHAMRGKGRTPDGRGSGRGPGRGPTRYNYEQGQGNDHLYHGQNGDGPGGPTRMYGLC